MGERRPHAVHASALYTFWLRAKVGRELRDGASQASHDCRRERTNAPVLP